MGMTWSPSFRANFFLSSSSLVAFLCSWRGPHVQLRSWRYAQCHHCMRLLFSPKPEQREGQAELSTAGCLRSSYWPMQRQAWCMLGAACGSSSVYHLLLIISESCMGLAHWKLPCAISQAYFSQQDFLWISFCGMAAPSPLHLGIIWFGVLQVACENSWAC